MRSWNNSGSLWHPIASTYTSITQRVTQARHVVSCNLVKASPKQSIRLQTHTTVFAHILKDPKQMLYAAGESDDDEAAGGAKGEAGVKAEDGEDAKKEGDGAKGDGAKKAKEDETEAAPVVLKT